VVVVESGNGNSDLLGAALIENHLEGAVVIFALVDAACFARLLACGSQPRFPQRVVKASIICIEIFIEFLISFLIEWIFAE